MERVSRLFSMLRTVETLVNVMPFRIAIARPPQLRLGLSALIQLKLEFKENNLLGLRNVLHRSKISNSCEIARISVFLFAIPRQFHCIIFRLFDVVILGFA